MIFAKNTDEVSAMLSAGYRGRQVLAVADVNTAAFVPRGVETLVMPCGEEHKNIESVEQIWDFLHAHEATRDTVLLCTGGGTVTDTGGFAAATYKRGIDYLNIPTTLLAMVDASTGGKTGFNRNGVKNEIGCFKQPAETVICTALLNTLPREEILSGFAEMMKHALVADKREYVRLLAMLEDGSLQHTESAEFADAVKRSIAIKERIAGADPEDRGIRKTLNFGHTAGHALEAAAISKGRVLRHGYAVMQGMVAELYLSALKEGMPHEILQQMSSVMREYYGRAECGCNDMKELLRLMRSDKKNKTAGETNFTLLADAGKPLTDRHAGEKETEEALEYLFSI
ncbi:MAG: 3-dehydroquinate synthase [Paludibacteraceae bacterium]|nr:3-dehydroquinate synthase [Paludibacteraceae bacterium]